MSKEKQMTALVDVRVSGKVIPKDKGFFCDLRTAKQLKGAGQAREGAPETTVDQNKIRDVALAIAELNPETDYTQDKKPKIKPLEAAYKGDVSEAERDQAFAMFKSQQ